ncbi:MAG: glycosyltransferase, partial [Ktedonobacterales bacterium]|nr:glycosyltransferase [Ktedonobacterales bacterium]
HLPALDPAIRQILRQVAPHSPTTPAAPPAARLVTVSRACAAGYQPFCAIADVIYNGIEIERIPFGARAVATDPYLLFAGRISPEKGVEDALDIATRAGRRLILAGGIYDAEYFRVRIAPRLCTRATYRGAVGRERLWRLMAGAEAVLCPIAWEEPFGLVACEAQAAGTPVVGYARGALPEVVDHEKTGCLVSPGDVAAAVAALPLARALDRGACRAHVYARFSLAAMLAAYEAHYAEMLGMRTSGEEGRP